MMKNRKNTKKGAAMEMALLVMFVVFGLSILIVSSSMIHANRKNEAENSTAFRLEMDTVGEYVCQYVTEHGILPASLPEKYGEYRVERGFDAAPFDTYRIFVHHEDDPQTTLLHIELKDNGDGTYTVLTWEYGTPDGE